MKLYSAISSNKLRTYIIMLLFIAFITVIVYVFSVVMNYGLGLVGFALIFAGFTSIGSFYFSDKIVLATTGAKPANLKEYPAFYRAVENLSIAAGLPMPKIYIIEDRSPNAFATGRDPKHAVVCATTGLLEMMNKTELEGVIAHELSHVKNYDIRLMGVVAVLIGFVALLSDIFIRAQLFKDSDNNKSGAVMLLIAIILATLSPIAAMLIQASISRRRESLADASGALLTRYPEGLASALEKLAADHTPPKTASNATAHLFIENPFDNKKVQNFFTNLFNTHPPIEERIKALRSM